MIAKSGGWWCSDGRRWSGRRRGGSFDDSHFENEGKQNPGKSKLSSNEAPIESVRWCEAKLRVQFQCILGLLQRLSWQRKRELGMSQKSITRPKQRKRRRTGRKAVYGVDAGINTMAGGPCAARRATATTARWTEQISATVGVKNNIAKWCSFDDAW